MRNSRSVKRFVIVITALLVAISTPTTALPVSAEDESHSSFLEQHQSADGAAIDHGSAVSGVSHKLEPHPSPKELRPPSDDDISRFQQVFPPDTRQRVSPTTYHPARAFTFLLGTTTGCSGTFIGPNVALTAAHCIYTSDEGWQTSVQVVPGADGDVAPYGYQFAEWAWIPAGWVETENLGWDWGILVMPDSNLGNTVGWLDMAILSTETLGSGFDHTTAGYPGDKPFGTMWASSESSFLDVDDVLLYTRIDSMGGQSGSSVWGTTDGLIVGVLSFETETFNAARRINELVINSLIDVCYELACAFDYWVEDFSPPPPPPQPDPPPPSEPDPPPPAPDPSPPDANAPVFASGPEADQASAAFNNTRARTDRPVETGQVNRTWMWGPHANSAPIEEPYIGAPGDSRVVTYFDKSRMEDNDYRADPPWNVTNGLLVMELITGRMQISDHSWDDRDPADVQVAGDDHPDSPTYAMLDPLRSWDPIPVGAPVIQRLQPDGAVTEDGSLGQHGVTAGHMVADTNHTVASVFWDFMNSSGTIYDNGSYRHDNLFENSFFATGFPITEAYWVHVPVGGDWQDVLLQCFERRCLTYTPGNSAGWQVEAGNVGQHYYRWRYGDSPAFP